MFYVMVLRRFFWSVTAYSSPTMINLNISAVDEFIRILNLVDA